MVRYQANKKTDFTVDLTWWGSLRLAPNIFTIVASSNIATPCIKPCSVKIVCGVAIHCYPCDSVSS